MPNNASWQPDANSKLKLAKRLNEEIGDPFGLEFHYLETDRNVPNDGVRIMTSFYGHLNGSIGEASLAFLKNGFMDIKIPEIDKKYTISYCKTKANKHKNEWILRDMDFDNTETIETIYHELMHALVEAEHVDYSDFKKAVNTTVIDSNGREKECWKLKPAEMEKPRSLYSVVQPDTVMDYGWKRNNPVLSRTGLSTHDAIMFGERIGYNRQHFTAEKQLGDEIFRYTFNISEAAPIASANCNLKNGYGTTSSPSRAFLVIDARECFSGANSSCENCTSVLGEKPFDENMVPRRESMLHGKLKSTPHLWHMIPRSIRMFTATPQATLFGDCNFVVAGINRANGSEPIRVHTSVHVSAPAEGVNKEYGAYKSVLSYVIDAYDEEKTPNCMVNINSNSKNDKDRVMSQVEAVKEMLQNAAIKAHESVGGDLCEQFAVGNNIKDPAMLNIAIQFANSGNEKLDKCMNMTDGVNFSVSNVLAELENIIEKQSEAERGSEPIAEKHINAEERAAAQTMHDEIAKSINVTAKSSATGQVVTIASASVCSAVALSCAALIARQLKRKLSRSSQEKEDQEDQEKGDKLQENAFRKDISEDLYNLEEDVLMQNDCVRGNTSQTLADAEEAEIETIPLRHISPDLHNDCRIEGQPFEESSFINKTESKCNSRDRKASLAANFYKTPEGKSSRREMQANRKKERDTKFAGLHY